MKLSEHTQSVLKNFATINQNLVIKKGSKIDARKDLYKVLHYGIMALHINNLENDDEPK